MRIRRITHARAAHRHQATCMYWDHMTGWGWTMMLLWTILLVVLVAGRHLGDACEQPPCRTGVRAAGFLASLGAGTAR